MSPSSPHRRRPWSVYGCLGFALLLVSCLERVELDSLPFACATDRVCRSGHVCDMDTRTCVEDPRVEDPRDVSDDEVGGAELAPINFYLDVVELGTDSWGTEDGSSEQETDGIPDKADDTGEVDMAESPQEILSCADGEPCDDGDACTRQDTCVLGSCMGTIPSRDEACDGVDEDCDGLTDDEWMPGPKDCKHDGVCAGQEIPAICVDGQVSCDYSAVAGYSGAHEVACDGVDENCNGLIDEGVCH